MEESRKRKDGSAVGKKGGLPRDSAGWGGELQATRSERARVREGGETKYPYVVHAELNAVLNANGRDLRGSKLYVALFPCNECAKAIIQSGVKEVYYLSDKYADSMSTLASKRMLDSAGVKYTQLRTNLKEITLSFVPEEELK